MAHRKWRWALVAVASMVVASPALAGYARNEFWVNQQLGALVAELPHRTSAIRVGIGSGGPPCSDLVAQVLATELPREKVARFFSQTPLEVELAWSEPSGFRHWTRRDGIEKVDEGKLPAPVRKLLVAYAFLPRGVHRVVVYRRIALPHHADPRCWSIDLESGKVNPFPS